MVSTPDERSVMWSDGVGGVVGVSVLPLFSFFMPGGVGLASPDRPRCWQAFVLAGGAVCLVLLGLLT